MKRSTFLKAVFSVALILGTMGAFAQGHGTLTENITGGVYVDYVTVGNAMPYVSTPDDGYNPSWAFAEGTYTKSGAVNNWTWTVPYGGTGVNSADVTSPYVTILWDAIGSGSNLTVRETAASGAACPGADVSGRVDVVQVPRIDFATVDADVCFGDIAADLTFTFNILEDVPVATGGNFDFSYSLDIQNVDGAGANPTEPTAPEISAATTLTEGQTDLTNVTPTRTTTDGDGTAGSGVFEHDIVIPQAQLAIVNSAPTRYTWTLITTGGGKGITSKISRKSDKLNGSTTWYEVGTTGDGSTAIDFAYTIYPTPTTGPIFTVPN